MSALGDLQFLHVELVSQLIQHTIAQGYQVKWGECYRTPEQAAWNAEHGSGIKNSLHTQRLAVDLLLFKDGAYLTDSADYAFMGAFWKTLSPLARWGGDFSKPDGDHFSLEWQGVK